MKPLTEVKYLNADNVSRYRCIMRIFFDNYEKLRYWLYQEDVFEELKKDPHFEDYRMEQCQQDLAMLTEWKEILCPHNKLFIVENPSVFAMLCEINAGNHAFMCMNGQPRLAGLNVLEVCGASGVEVYYAGDFDPEGLLIAQKLHDFYKGVFHYWHLSVEDYMECRSDRQISAKRLKALDKIVDPVLQSVAAGVKDLQTAGY